MRDGAQNQHDVIALNPGGWSGKFAAALEFLRWITSEEGQLLERKISRNPAGSHAADSSRPTLCVQFRTIDLAQRTAQALGTKTLEKSGWHVYNNMEQILSWTDPEGHTPMRRNMLPKTDNILSRKYQS
jgi:ABC-type glycerol-3-phosphate transport system substrate-binding protein